jgi:uncharacterized protein
MASETPASGPGPAAARLPGTSTTPGPAVRRPGSDGEHALQHETGTAERAQRFYDDQVLDRLNPAMRDFVRCQKMMFIATSDAAGECDNSFRAGPPGFVHVIDERTVAWPEFRGNGVMASMGNLLENPHVGLLMVDFVRDTVGLHVNGLARIISAADMKTAGFESDGAPAGRHAAYWVVVAVEEAYIHCSKHIPRLVEMDPADAASARRTKTADYFGAAATAPLRCDVDEAS